MLHHWGAACHFRQHLFPFECGLGDLIESVTGRAAILRRWLKDSPFFRATIHDDEMPPMHILVLQRCCRAERLIRLNQAVAVLIELTKDCERAEKLTRRNHAVAVAIERREPTRPLLLHRRWPRWLDDRNRNAAPRAQGQRAELESIDLHLRCGRTQGRQVTRGGDFQATQTAILIGV